MRSNSGGDIYTSAGEIYEPNGAPIVTFPITSRRQKGQLAVNSSGVIYDIGETSSVEHQHVMEFVPSSFPVTLATTYTEVAEPLTEPPPVPYQIGHTVVSLSRRYPKAIAVEPATNDLYVDEQSEYDAEGHTDPGPSYVLQLDEAGQAIGSPFGLEREGALDEEPQNSEGKPEVGGKEGPASEGIAVDGAAGEGDVYVTNANSGSQSDVFGPLAFLKAQVEAETVSEISASGATVTAKINPEGEATTYRVEYAPSGEEGCFASESCSATAPVSVGEGEAAVPIEARLSGLQPGTRYALRILATNGLGTNMGQAVAFTTLLAASQTSSALPDGRTYEGVSLPASVERRSVSARDGTRTWE